MKKSIYIISFLCFSALSLSFTAHSQSLTGTKSIPGDYATAELAIAALNANGVGSGGVTFNITAGHAETFSSPTAGHITATGTASNQIIFQKSGDGANPQITAGTGTGSYDGIIVFRGTDYITFDGIDILENSTNTSNTARMEWGFALVKKQNTAPFDGCQNVVIKNCSITLNKSNTNTRGIYSGNHIATSTSALTITDIGDTNSNCEFYSNTITNCFQGMCLNGYNAPSPYALYDQNNKIGVPAGNVISDFGSAGIYFIYQNNIAANNNNLSETTGPNTIIYGIRAETATGAKTEISNNIISLKNGSISASLIYGISCKSGSNVSGSEVKINGNTIENCSYTAAVAQGFYGINAETNPPDIEIKNNIIRNNTMPGVSDFYGINKPSSSTNITVSGNTITGNTKTGSSGIMYCVYLSGGTNLDINNNNISNNSIPNASGTIETSAYGISSSGATNITISGNTFGPLIVGGSNTYATNRIRAISINSGSENQIFGNRIHGLSLTSGFLDGIYIRSGKYFKTLSKRNV